MNHIDLSTMKSLDKVKYKGNWSEVELSNDCNYIICDEHTKNMVVLIEDIALEIEDFESTNHSYSKFMEMCVRGLEGFRKSNHPEAKTYQPEHYGYKLGEIVSYQAAPTAPTEENLEIKGGDHFGRLCVKLSYGAVVYIDEDCDKQFKYSKPETIVAYVDKEKKRKRVGINTSINSSNSTLGDTSGIQLAFNLM